MNKKQQVEVNPDVIRSRCRQARYMNRMTQDTAAKLLGYKNTATISKMESVSSKTPINLEFLLNASKLYGVSLDYLFGLSDYPERDPQTLEQMAYFSAIKHFITNELDKFTLSIINNIPKYNSIGIAGVLLERLIENAQQVSKLRELNPQFDEDLRGGAKYVKFLEDTDKDIRIAKRFLNNGRCDPEIMRNVSSILDDVKEKQQLELNYYAHTDYKDSKEHNKAKNRKQNKQQ